MNRSLSVVRRVFLSGIMTLGFFTPSASAGSLEPPANAVNGSGSPASTMKTLEQIPPTWSQVLPASERFEVLSRLVSGPFGIPIPGRWGVLDHETGLVWQLEPEAEAISWSAAHIRCTESNVGGRRGWRLPQDYELVSLVDGSEAPALPPGHPFLNVQERFYWTDTLNPAFPLIVNGAIGARSVDFRLGGRSGSAFNIDTSLFYWCVRGS